MKFVIVSICALVYLAQCVRSAAIIDPNDGEASVHFGFQTENGQIRSEDISYNTTKSEDDVLTADGKVKHAVMPVEYKGGYSFVSADGYEYMVLYKANKNGFQPYVTARKIKN